MFRITTVIATVLLAVSTACADARIAIWDPSPGSDESRYAFDMDYLRTVTGWLKSDGLEVDWLTAADVVNGERFNARRYAALIMHAGAMPQMMIAPCRKFTNAGGVLVNLGAERPFMNIVKPGVGGKWELFHDKGYKWQQEDMLNYVGVKFQWEGRMRHVGTNHEPTALLKRYAADMRPVVAPAEHVFLYPTDDAQFYPLVRSQRPDGKDVTPQLFIARRGKVTTIIGTNANQVFTGTKDVATWPWGKQTVIAIACIALDLHSGDLVLTDDMVVDVPRKLLPQSLPLQNRAPTEGTDPGGIKPIVRWGRFNGSSLELPKTATDELPQELAPGAKVTLAMPPLPGGACFVRLRGAYGSNGAELKVVSNGKTLWHEQFVHHVAKGKQNMGMFDYGVQPYEFHRIAFMPIEARGKTLTLSNPGTQTLYFDAVQVEARSPAGMKRVLGLGSGVKPTPIPRNITSTWSSIRSTIRTQWAGAPGTPDRWARIDRAIESKLAFGCPVDLLFEGTNEWTAINALRYKRGKDFNRPRTVVPDTKRFSEIVRHIIGKYGDRIHHYELWNEVNTYHFWRGSIAEYMDYHKAMAKIVREMDPGATITGGLAGTTAQCVDPWVAAFARSGVLEHDMDWFVIHCYDSAAAWDARFGLIEGHLYNVGSHKPIYANEQGFARRKAGTEDEKRRLTNIAMARLHAENAALINNFHTGGHSGPDYSYFDRHGKPYPVYTVFDDYLNLAKRGGRHLPATIMMADGSSVRGVYVAASVHNDGTYTVVVNPADGAYREPAPPTPPNEDFQGKVYKRWSIFFADKPDWGGGSITLRPAKGKDYVGFYRKTIIDPKQFPFVEVNASKVDGHWDLLIKYDKVSKKVASSDKPGKVEVNWAELSGATAKREYEFSFRTYGTVTLSSMRYPGTSNGPSWQRPAANVVVRVPMLKPEHVTANSQQTNVAVITHRGASPWAELKLTTDRRTVVHLK